MQQHLTDDPDLTAQQIAFFNVGNQYCSHYYADPTAWSGWMVPPTLSLQGRPTYPSDSNLEKSSAKEAAIPAEEEIDAKKAALNQKYGSLTYSQYYNRYVLPKIPAALQTLQNP